MATRPQTNSAYTRLRDHVFGTLYLMSRKRKESRKLAALGVGIEAVQVLSFPLTLFSSGREASYFDAPIHPSTPATSHMVPAAFWFAFAWTTCFLALGATVVTRFAMGRKQHSLMLQALNSVAMLSTGPLFLPFAQLLLFGFKCESGTDTAVDTDVWLMADTNCWSPEHLTAAVAVGLLFAGMCAVSLLVTLTVRIESLHTSAASDAGAATRTANAASHGKLHGRNDAAYLLFKIALAALATFFTSWSPSLLGSIYAAAGAIWIFMNLSSPGETDVTGIHVRVMLAAVFAWTSFCAVVGDAVDHDTARYVCITGLAVAGACGYLSSVLRFHRLLSRPITAQWAAANPALANVWLFAWLRHPLLETTGVLAAYKPASTVVQTTSGIKAVTGPPGRCGVSFAGSAPTGMTRSVAGNTVQFAAEPQSPKLPTAASVASTCRPRPKGSKAQDPLDLPPFIANIVRELEELPSPSVLALYVLSHFHAAVTGNRFMEVNLLRKISLASPPLDLQFLVYSRLRSHQEASSGSNVRGIDRVLFDQHQDANEHALRVCYDTRAEMCGYLLSSEPDIGQVVKYGYRFEKYSAEASRHMQTMVRLHPSSEHVLRLLSLFYSELEPNRARFDKYAAVHRRVQVSAEASTIGEIVTASRATRIVFGRHPSTLVGDNISSIMPSPFREAHDSLLLRYISRGRGNFMGSTRVVFALQAGSTLSPFWLTLREAPPVDGDTRPLFVGILQAVDSLEGHLLVTSPETGYRVIAGCSRSQALLGLDGEALSNEMPSLARWIQEFAHGTVQPKTSDDEDFVTTVVDETLPDDEGVSIRVAIQTVALPGMEVSFLVHWQPEASDITRLASFSQHNRRRNSTVAALGAGAGAGAGSSATITADVGAVQVSSDVGSSNDDSSDTDSSTDNDVNDSPCTLHADGDPAAAGGAGDDQAAAALLLAAVDDAKLTTTNSDNDDQSTSAVVPVKSRRKKGGSRVHPQGAEATLQTKAAASVSNSTLSAVRHFIGALRGLKDSTPREVKQIKLFYHVVFLTIVAAAIALWVLLTTDVDLLYKGIEIVHSLEDVNAASSRLITAVWLTQLHQSGWNVTGSLGYEDTAAESLLYHIDTLGSAFEHMDSSIDTEWPRLQHAWYTDRISVGADAEPLSVQEAMLEAQHIGVRYADDLQQQACPSAYANQLTMLLWELQAERHHALELLSEDVADVHASMRFNITLVLIVIGALLLTLLAVWVVPVLRKLEGRTVNLLAQIVLLPMRSLRTLHERAVEQRDAFVGELSRETAFMEGAESGDDAASDTMVDTTSKSETSRSMSRTRHNKYEHHARPYRNTWRFVSKTMAQFLIPLVAVAVWITALFLMSATYINRDNVLRSYMHTGALYGEDAHLVRAYTLTSLANGTPETLRAQLAYVDAEMRATERAWSFGDPDMGIAGKLPHIDHDSAVAMLLYHDACPFIMVPISSPLHNKRQTTPPPTGGECLRTTALGLAPSLKHLSSVGQQMVSTVNATCAAPPDADTQALFTTWLQESDDAMVALRHLLLLLEDDTEESEKSFVIWFRVTIAIFVLASSATLMWLASRVSNAVAQIMRLTITMLLLLPEELLVSSPRLAAEAKKLLVAQS